ncbi:hypothetical protein [Streptomyces fractus]|uniref:hypothetical protein n=1 Tax=Streptomyces fractus TaxID=641806 RepID=UPI003CE9316B
MADYVMAATDADGKRLGERTLATAPEPGEAAALGDSHRSNYVSVRHGHEITLYGRDATGAWTLIAADAPAPVVVELRRQHDAACGPRPAWDDEPASGHANAPAADNAFSLTAIGVDGERFGERVSSTTPTHAEAVAFGELHESDYVLSGRNDSDVVTLYGRDTDSSWSVLAADVAVEAAQEICLWFDLTHHYQGPSSAARHPLDDVPAPEYGRLTAEQAIARVVEYIQVRGLDYPTQGLTADRFAAGWSVFAPVDVDDSDPMAFLDMPVGRSVFLISDIGRVKEISSSIPPHQAEQMFTAEETYVRRPPAGDRFMTGLKDEVMRLEAESGNVAGISSFTVEVPSTEVIAARASQLVGPIAQQLALLGPPGWDRFTAVFSFTVSAEVAHLRFRSGKRSTEVPVPEQVAVLVRRQRHLAARMPAGPWWRLQLSVSHTPQTGANVTTDYDYGDEPFPDEDLLAREHYRNDLAAYPRDHTPAWLSAYVSGTDGPGHPSNAPGVTSRTTPGPTGPRNNESAKPTERHAPAGPADAGPVLDTRIGRKPLHASPAAITYGKKSIALDQVEWVAYAATHTATKRFLYPTTHHSTWDFLVGRYPYYGAPLVRVDFYESGRRAEQPPEWAFLVNLVRQYVEPRLLTQLLARVRRGETITVGGSVNVSEAGITCTRPRLDLPWESVRVTHDGIIRIYQTGSDKPLLNVPLTNPNAVLIPDLFAALAS